MKIDVTDSVQTLTFGKTQRPVLQNLGDDAVFVLHGPVGGGDPVAEGFRVAAGESMVWDEPMWDVGGPRLRIACDAEGAADLRVFPTPESVDTDI